MRTSRHHPILSKVAFELRRMRQYPSKEAKKERKATRKAKKDEKHRVKVANSVYQADREGDKE